MCAHTYRWPAVYAYAYVFIRICWLLINYTATWICICYVGSYPPLVKNRPNQSDTIIDYVWWRIIVCVHTSVLTCYVLQVFVTYCRYLLLCMFTSLGSPLRSPVQSPLSLIMTISMCWCPERKWSPRPYFVHTSMFSDIS